MSITLSPFGGLETGIEESVMRALTFAVTIDSCKHTNIRTAFWLADGSLIGVNTTMQTCPSSLGGVCLWPLATQRLLLVYCWYIGTATYTLLPAWQHQAYQERVFIAALRASDVQEIWAQRNPVPIC